MARLPVPGSDDGTWGDILNTFLEVEHNTDGTLKNGLLKASGLTTSQLLRTDTDTKAAAVTVGSGLSFDGTTLTASASSLAVTSKTANYTITTSDDLVLASAAGGAFTVTLPTAVGKTGRIFKIKRTNSGSNNVTVGTTSSQTIDGSTTYTISTQYQSIDVISDGSNWHII